MTMPDPKPSSLSTTTTTTSTTTLKHSSKSEAAAPITVSDVQAPPSELTSSENQPPSQISEESLSTNDSSVPDSADIIDLDTFHQILDLDEAESHEFSKGMAFAYLSQAKETFQEMDEALAASDLEKLSSLGHFLKGSSAALGVTKVQASCERMQNIGQRRDDETGDNLTDQDALDKIRSLLAQVKLEYDDAAKWLKNWYKNEP